MVVVAALVVVCCCSSCVFVVCCGHGYGCCGSLWFCLTCFIVVCGLLRL